MRGEGEKAEGSEFCLSLSDNVDQDISTKTLSFLDKKENYKFKKLDDIRKLYDLYGGVFVIEYDDVYSRDIDFELFKKNVGNKLYNIPNPMMEIGYNGKYYIVLQNQDSNNNYIDEDKGIYNGIVFNIQKILQIPDLKEEIIEKISEIL